jgi:predicted TIM-barrel fold metal-dependent hydrolase
MSEMSDVSSSVSPLTVDVDIHIDDSPEALLPFIDLPWQRAVAEPIANPPWSIHGTLYPSLATPRPGATPARTPEDVAAYLAAEGIDAGIVLPTAIMKIGVLPNADYAIVLARAYNRWLASAWLGHGGGVFGAIIVAPHDPAEAAREIASYAGNPRIAGVLLPMGGVDPLWGNRKYDPIYEAAIAAGLPVILHGGNDLLLPGTTNYTPIFTSRFEQHAMSQPLLAMANLVAMVGTGLFARYPELRVVFLDAGLSWFTHIVLRMDKEYNENRRDIPYFTDRPSKYLKRQVWLGTHPLEVTQHPEEFSALAAIGNGIERLLYGSNWPYPDRDEPGRVAAVLPDATIRGQVMGGNAAALFNLDVASVSRTAAPTGQV